MEQLLQLSESGLYCAQGDFHVDPWGAVERAIITHAHPDHARVGSKNYLTTREGEPLLRTLLGDDAAIASMEYGDSLDFSGVKVTLHPAGHIPGSAQVRMEFRGEVWVISGDYKPGPDVTCREFEPLRCHTFVTDATFALPIYRWLSQREVFDQINKWWRSNRERGRTSVLFAHSVGKAQRVLSGLDPSIGPILTHSTVETVNGIYRSQGIPLPLTTIASDFSARGAIIVAPPASGTSWTKRFGALATGFVSGWMRIRGPRRRRAVDRGFVLSDHADWPGLLSAIESTGASSVWAVHGYSSTLVRWLEGKGLQARAVETRFEGELS